MVSSTLVQFLFHCYVALVLFSLSPAMGLTLESARGFLTREEDTIVFSLIERAKYPYNPPAYDPRYLGGLGRLGNRTLVELFIRESEAIQAKAGRYQNPEEVPFFRGGLSLPLIPPYNFPKVLYPSAASFNVSQTIWNLYFNELLPQFTTNGTDGNLALTMASDLACLQALSRRIHYGRFVAEVKFTDAPQDYVLAIRAKDRDALMKLLTSESQEEVVKRRVKKKAMVFGQDVILDNPVDSCDSNSTRTSYKVDPMVVYRLYGDWIIPLTKLVEVEYLLRRLD